MMPLVLVVAASLIGGAAVAVTAGALNAPEPPRVQAPPTRLRPKARLAVLPEKLDNAWSWQPVLWDEGGENKMPDDQQPKLSKVGETWTLPALANAIKAVRKDWDAMVVIPNWGLSGHYLLVNMGTQEGPDWRYVEVTLTKYLATYLEDRGIMVWVMQNSGPPLRWSSRNDVD